MVNVITKVTSAFVEFTKQSIAAYSEFENVRTNLQIVLGDMELATSTFEELKELGAKTPFSVTGLTEAATQLVQTGTAVEDLTETLRLLGDVSGGSQEKFNRIVQNYAQIQSVGKTTSMDIRQFAMAGLPIYEELEKLGVQGNATAEEINAAFKSMAGEGGKFFNGMAIQSETLTGKVSTLKDTWQEFQATFAETFNIDGLSKWWTDLKTTVLEEAIEVMEFFSTKWPEMKARNERLENGTYSGQDVLDAWKAELVFAEEEFLRLRDIVSKIDFSKNDQKSINSLLNQYSKASDYYFALLRGIESLEQGFERIASYDNLNSTEERVAGYNKEYTEMYAQVEEMFARTEQGKRKELQATLEMLEEAKKLREWEVSENKATGLYSATAKQQDEEYLTMIDVLIENTISEMDKLNEVVEDSILTWREYWETVTGQNIEGKTGAIAAEEYLATFETRRQKALEVGAVFGDDKNDINRAFLNELKALVEKLVTKEGLDENFTLQDDSVNTLIKAYQKLLKEIPEETKEIPKGTGEPIKDVFKGWVTELEEAFRDSLENGDLWQSLGQGTGYAFAAATTGTDVGTFANSYVETGSVETALIETLIQSLAELVGGFEGLELILNPVQDLLKGFEPILKSAALVLYYVMSPLRLLGEGLQKWFGWLFGDMADAWDELVDSQKEEIEKMKDLTAQYEKLKSAIKDQEEYYLKKKTDLNAQTEINNLTKVNDMILTPNGNFSTHPDDYLIATKNPHSLGGVTVNVKIENTVSDSVNANVSQTTNAKGEQELIVMISKKIAGDVANGANGWDSALNARSQRLQGRMISL